MPRIVPVVLVLLGAAIVTTPTPPPATAQQPANKEDVALAKLFRAWLDEEFQAHPLFATQQGNHDHDDRLDDLSPEARKADLDRARTWLGRLPKSIDR
ncbi:MAG TPA: DUF885 domain-containing protein, partial [Gemmata sp.]|nr:DUF885 domain-containing protein [Gemmata sp.]